VNRHKKYSRRMPRVRIPLDKLSAGSRSIRQGLSPAKAEGRLRWFGFRFPLCRRGSMVNNAGEMKNLGILLSGRGSNFVAIGDSIEAGRIPGARISVVISNRADAPGIEIARRRGLNALVIVSKGRDRETHDREVVTALKQYEVDLVCLAGYMRLLSPWFVQQFPRKILNIHPALLPSFPGLEAQQQAFAYGVKVSGCTVHFVDEELDHGAIIVQKTVPVLESDDEHSLANRILEQEHIAYSEAIRMVLEGGYEIVGRRLVRSQKSEVKLKK
jgi:phosphoribosylglycinamide formyltransferase-1